MMEKNRRDVLKLSGIAALGASSGLSAGASAVPNENSENTPTENPLHGTLPDLSLINHTEEDRPINYSIINIASNSVVKEGSKTLAGRQSVDKQIRGIGEGPFRLDVSDNRGNGASQKFPMPKGGFGGSSCYDINIESQDNIRIVRRWV